MTYNNEKQNAMQLKGKAMKSGKEGRNNEYYSKESN